MISQFNNPLGIKMKESSKKKPVPIAMTPSQKAWVKAESERTGESYAAVVRRLIQEKIEG